METTALGPDKVWWVLFKDKFIKEENNLFFSEYLCGGAKREGRAQKGYVGMKGHLGI